MDAGNRHVPPYAGRSPVRTISPWGGMRHVCLPFSISPHLDTGPCLRRPEPGPLDGVKAHVEGIEAGRADALAIALNAKRMPNRCLIAHLYEPLVLPHTIRCPSFVAG
jgi:hypothetical protein